jgi:hypothetical protein
MLKNIFVLDLDSSGNHGDDIRKRTECMADDRT